jgi:hypothetical protein
MAATYAVIQTVGLIVLLSVGFSVMAKTVIALSPKCVAQLSTAELAEYN